MRVTVPLDIAIVLALCPPDWRWPVGGALGVVTVLVAVGGWRWERDRDRRK